MRNSRRISGGEASSAESRTGGKVAVRSSCNLQSGRRSIAEYAPAHASGSCVRSLLVGLGSRIGSKWRAILGSPEP